MIRPAAAARGTGGRRLGYLSAAPRVSSHPEAETGGPRTHILGVIGAFGALGWQVIPYIVGDRLPRSWNQESERRLERSPLIRLAADLIRLFMGMLHSLLAWRELNGRVDWVYERLAVLQNLGWIFRLRGTPWILETNGLNFYEAKLERKSIVLADVARALELWAYRRCDVVVCITAELKSLIAALAGIDPGKILVVPNGVDIKVFDPSGCEPKRLSDSPVIGFVSALIQWHRLDLLLESLAELRHEGIQYHLVVIGDGPMRSAWARRAEELGLESQVKFVGRVSKDEVPAHIAGFDLGYVGNSPMANGKMYHSPLKLYEYMAMGVPVISADCADAREMILAGQSGYIFEPASQKDLVATLRRAFQERNQWVEMGAAARRRILEHATWELRVRGMIAGVERILDMRGAR